MTKSKNVRLVIQPGFLVGRIDAQTAAELDLKRGDWVISDDLSGDIIGDAPKKLNKQQALLHMCKVRHPLGNNYIIAPKGFEKWSTK